MSIVIRVRARGFVFDARLREVSLCVRSSWWSVDPFKDEDRDPTAAEELLRILRTAAESARELVVVVKLE